MPRRNLLALLAVTLLALLCYQRVQKNAYGRMLANALNKIENRSLEPIPALQLFEGAMEGMIGTLKDDYSVYISPAELDQFRETIDQEFGGIGVQIALDLQTRQLTVRFPLPGSPALKAGIRAGDRIVRIRDAATQGMSLSDAATLLRGKPGDSVTLTVLHEGQEKPVEVTIVREVIQVNTVLGDTRNADGSWNFFLEGQDRIGYIRISSFTENTADELRRTLPRLVEQGMRGLVLDLRDNPGGYVRAAIKVCEMLIPSGVIVTTRGRDGRISHVYAASGNARFTASGNAPFTKFPMAVLVNQDSASAAEIVAACLQDHDRAVVVGQQSYGKGTIQEIIDLEDGCGAMKLTTASYWRPSGKNIARPRNAAANDTWGVTPNQGYQVDMKGDEVTGWRVWRFGRDGFQPAANGSPAKNAAQPFTDRPLVRAVEYLVEYLEKEAGSRR